ncbi:MFS transporter [Propionispira raffinosivorans]|uniref:MFS transporter n=1 Tax=Propionispira raffinosivorans TaxID=86959 RepID=UPI0003732627|nr:MFS transporter [Propionispira raffinosivorans]
MEIGEKPTKARLGILALLFVAVAINYMDRANLSVAGSAIQSQFDLSATELGILFSAFTWSYTIAQIPVGILLDKFGPRLLYGAAITIWGLFTFIMAFSSQVIFITASASFAFLIFCRILIGIAEAPAYPSNTKIASLWFPNKERARAISTYSSAQYIGLAIFTPVLAIMVANIGWESVFYFSGGIAIVYGFVWYAFYRDPKDSKKVNQQELDYIKNNGGYNPDVDGTKQAEKVSWAEVKYVVKQRRVWGIFIAQFAASSTLYFFLTWFIVYLQKGLHLSIDKAGFTACVPYLMAMAGVLIGGTISDTLLKRGKSTTFARKCPMVVGMIISAVLCLANFFEDSPIIAVGILSIAFFANAASNLGWVAMSDIMPKKMMGTVGAILNVFGNLSGILTPIVFGTLLQATNNFHLAMDYIAAISFFGAIGFLFVVDKLEPIDLTKMPKDSI